MDKNLTFMEHLEELRRRILIALIAIFLAGLVAFFFSDQILSVLLLPFGSEHLKAFSLLDGFMIKWRIALYSGIVAAFPIWAYQLYQFLRPGLIDNERRIIFPMTFGSMVLFGIGTAFGYYLLWGMIRVLTTFFPPQVDLLPTADGYISFVVFFLLSCGLAFQLPTALILLVQLRILNSKLMQRQRRTAYFVLFVFAEIITPVSDPIVAPLTIMVPLVLLYELSIFFAKRVENNRLKTQNSQSSLAKL